MSDIQTTLEQLLQQALSEARNLSTTEEIQLYEQKYLGRKSQLNESLRQVKDLDPEVRKAVGQKGNDVKQRISEEISKLTKVIADKEYQTKLATEKLDVTGSTHRYIPGSLHPLTKERQIIEDIFLSMGFMVHEPMMIDDEYHNFTSLNIPENHPAKDMWDTIWTEDNQYLITHTSSMQNRIIRNSNPPIRAIVPGKCFRNEATDRTHEHTFNQVEGIYVDKGIKLSDLLGVLRAFLNRYFESEIEVKIQPTFFPFVEPGIEIMMNYSFFAHRLGIEGGELNNKWIEVIPCGPIHPKVIAEAGLDPEVYSGFAWGMGLDRLALLKYAIDDIRLFHSGKLDFIKQFN
jgi:phenylalanyl-tRNA synthetase alpha chain